MDEFMYDITLYYFHDNNFLELKKKLKTSLLHEL